MFVVSPTEVSFEAKSYIWTYSDLSPFGPLNEGSYQRLKDEIVFKKNRHRKSNIN